MFVIFWERKRGRCMVLGEALNTTSWCLWLYTSCICVLYYHSQNVFMCLQRCCVHTLAQSCPQQKFINIWQHCRMTWRETEVVNNTGCETTLAVSVQAPSNPFPLFLVNPASAEVRGLKPPTSNTHTHTHTHPPLYYTLSSLPSATELDKTPPTWQPHTHTTLAIAGKHIQYRCTWMHTNIDTHTLTYTHYTTWS